MCFGIGRRRRQIESEIADYEICIGGQQDEMFEYLVYYLAHQPSIEADNALASRAQLHIENVKRRREAINCLKSTLRRLS